MVEVAFGELPPRVLRLVAPTVTGMIGRCWYCGREDQALTDEHVLSAKNLGGRLVAPDAVCQECNSNAGELEDQLARSVGVAELVGRHGAVISPRRPPRPQTDGIFPDRGEVTVQYGRGGLAVRNMKPRQISTDPDGTPVWEVAAGQEERFVARRAKRGDQVRAVGRPLTVESGMNVKYGIGTRNFDLWPRMGAKVALSLTSIVFEPAWLDTRGARALQCGFHQGRWDTNLYPNGVPWQFDELRPDDEIAALLRPGEHVVGLDRDGRGRAWMILFGRLVYELPIFDAPIPEQEWVWLLSPSGPQQRTPRGGAEMLELLRRRHREATATA